RVKNKAIRIASNTLNNFHQIQNKAGNLLYWWFTIYKEYCQKNNPPVLGFQRG
ncbi:unnamed protein product, partial [marine sediment metagenome]